MSQPPEREGGTGEAPSATRDSIGRSSPLDGSPSRFPTANRWKRVGKPVHARRGRHHPLQTPNVVGSLEPGS